MCAAISIVSLERFSALLSSPRNVDFELFFWAVVIGSLALWVSTLRGMDCTEHDSLQASSWL